MTNVKPEHYQTAYNRLYSYLRTKHPEVIKEYREFMNNAKDNAINNLKLLSDGD